MIGWIDCGTNCVSRPNRNSTNEIANATMNAAIELRENADVITPIET